jgi:hypothetical protein
LFVTRRSSFYPDERRKTIDEPRLRGLTLRTKILLAMTLAFFFVNSYSFAQSAVDKYPEAKVIQKELYEFDVARPVKHFDALPDGSDWFAVDEFGLLQTIIVRGTRYEKRFNEIQPQTAKFSPKGDFLIWMGLERSYDEKGFNTTKTTVYKMTKKSDQPDTIGAYTSDYNSLSFSKSGRHWIAILPAAKSDQIGLRDIVMIDGLIQSKNYPRPGMFSFDRDEKLWAYRSTDGADENLVTTFAVNKMYTRKVKNQMLPSPDPVIFHYTPDLKNSSGMLESRDYDFDFPHEAQVFKTSYFLDRQDTNHQYVIFNGKREPNFRWISQIQIDTAGTHIAYFACDTLGDTFHAIKNEKHGVLVEDGKIIAGAYDETGRVFISPSGKNLVWTASNRNEASLFYNGKKVGDVGNYIDMKWSPDEKKFAYITTTEKGKPFVVTGGKRSEVFDSIGRIAFSPDDKSIEYCAIKYNKLLHIKQSF